MTDSVLSGMSSDECIEKFVAQWKARDPVFRLDDPDVRDNLAGLLSVALSILATAPCGTWEEFLRCCATTAQATIPQPVLDAMKEVSEER
jgi:hypothetical protein